LTQFLGKALRASRENRFTLFLELLWMRLMMETMTPAPCQGEPSATASRYALLPAARERRFHKLAAAMGVTANRNGLCGAWGDGTVAGTNAAQRFRRGFAFLLLEIKGRIDGLIFTVSKEDKGRPFAVGLRLGAERGKAGAAECRQDEKGFSQVSRDLHDKATDSRH